MARLCELSSETDSDCPDLAAFLIGTARTPAMLSVRIWPKNVLQKRVCCGLDEPDVSWFSCRP